MSSLSCFCRVSPRDCNNVLGCTGVAIVLTRALGDAGIFCYPCVSQTTACLKRLLLSPRRIGTNMQWRFTFGSCRLQRVQLAAGSTGPLEENAMYLGTWHVFVQGQE